MSAVVERPRSQNFEPLNAQSHRHLRVRRTSTATPHFVQIVVSEFVEAAATCPILLSKDSETGNFYAGALFGFKPEESFLKDSIERGGFKPLHLQRDGFFTAGEQIVIDRNNPRFNEEEGDPLFDGALEPSTRLRQIQRVMGRLHAGIEATNDFIRALLDLKLVEAIDITLDFDRGEQMVLHGLYTVSLDSLRTIDDAAALKLFRAGHLQWAYTMHASLKQIAILAQYRNQKQREVSGQV
jgi:hypothetical protein